MDNNIFLKMSVCFSVLEVDMRQEVLVAKSARVYLCALVVNASELSTTQLKEHKHPEGFHKKCFLFCS